MIRFTTNSPGSTATEKPQCHCRGCRDTASAAPSNAMAGAYCSRFTNTWSPISSVSSMELEGISNACSTKRDDEQAGDQHSGQGGQEFDGGLARFFVDGLSSTRFSLALLPATCFFYFLCRHVRYPSRGFCSLISIVIPASADHPESPFPAGDLEHMADREGKVIKSITHGWRRGRSSLTFAGRPVDQQRPSNNIFTRHESPVAAVLAVVAIVSHHKIVAFGNNQLVVFHQLGHFFPPLRIHGIVGRLGLRKIIAIIIAAAR